MQPPWTAEQVVSPELAASLVEGQFPQLAPARVALLGSGFDNTAYCVNDEYVFRFPRRQIAADLLAVEIRVLPRVEAHLPLPISTPKLIGSTGAHYRWPFAGYRRLSGATACQAGLSDAQRGAAAGPLACFLRALHSVGAQQATSWGAPPDTIGRLDLARRIPQARDHLEKLVQRGILPSRQPWATLIDEAQSLRSPRAIALAHGDLYARHLLVNADGALCGVIDWGDLHVGDPAVDLAIAHAFLPPRSRQDFCDAYGSIDDETWRLARFRALQHALVVAYYACEVNDEALLRESRISLAHIAGLAARFD